MMRILGLVLALTLVVGCACFATQVTKTVYPGWNMVATPIAQYPDNASVATTFANVLSQWTGGRNCVYGWDPVAGGIKYNPLLPDQFPSITLGDGFMINVKTQTTVTYTGFPSGLADTDGGAETDMWISLPGTGTAGGWHYIGQPFNHDTMATAVSFTDGTIVKSWLDASATGSGKTPWVDKKMTGFGATGAFTVGPYGLTTTDRLQAGCSYQMLTKVPNIAMIIPATVAP